MRLSQNFTLEELARTGRTRLAARNLEIAATEPILTSLESLCVSILQPIRDHFGVPLAISSGLRYAEQVAGIWEGVDVAIRSGSRRSHYDPRSQHTRGEAADIHVQGCSTREVWEWIYHHSPRPFGQLIYETGSRSTWVHVSIPGNKIPERGGGSIRGVVTDAKQDRNGRWAYSTVDSVDRW